MFQVTDLYGDTVYTVYAVSREDGITKFLVYYRYDAWTWESASNFKPYER